MYIVRYNDIADERHTTKTVSLTSNFIYTPTDMSVCDCVIRCESASAMCFAYKHIASVFSDIDTNAEYSESEYLV